MEALEPTEVLGLLEAVERKEVVLTADAEPQASVVAIYDVHGAPYDAWRVAVFNDCGVWDYLEWVETPDERQWAFPRRDFTPNPAADYTPPRGQWWSRWGIPGYLTHRIEPWRGWNRTRQTTDEPGAPEAHVLEIAGWFDVARSQTASRAEIQAALRAALAGIERLGATTEHLVSACHMARFDLSTKIQWRCSHEGSTPKGPCALCARRRRTDALRALKRAASDPRAFPRAFAKRGTR